MENTETLQQANEAVDRYVQQIVHTLSPSAEIDQNDSLASNERDVGCLPPDNEYGASRRYAQRSYPIVKLENDTKAAVFLGFRKWAHENGFTVDATNENLETIPHLRATNREGYKASVQFKFGGFTVTASSPCVWRHGHPESAPQ